MNYKVHLLNNYQKLYKIKEMLETNDMSYYSITKINEKQLNDKTISIVMTSCNRSVQTYFTLDTISRSSYTNVQIIIVDDSTNDPIIQTELQKYNMHIELINIKNKFWVNPCINYNIGFNCIRGSKVIIQNAEVCHIGDVLNYINEKVQDDEYHAFNVVALKNIDVNNLLYNIQNLTYDNYQEISKLFWMWYQHPNHRNVYFHFLVALSKKTLDKIGGFDIDYALGIDYDDADFVSSMMKNNIKMINTPETIFGIHQWHTQTLSGSHSQNVNNKDLYFCKERYYAENKQFLNLTSYNQTEITDIINKLL